MKRRRSSLESASSTDQGGGKRRVSAISQSGQRQPLRLFTPCNPVGAQVGDHAAQLRDQGVGRGVGCRGFLPGLSPNRWRTRDCISIMFDRGNSDMKTTVLAAALLALLTSPAAASIDDEWWTAHGRNELAMISTRGSDAAVAAPTPPRAAPAPAHSRRMRAPARWRRQR